MKDINQELSNTTMIKTVKENPLPFALIGIGAGLLAYQSYAGKGRNGESSRFELRGELDSSKLASAAHSDTLDAASGKLGEVGGKISGVAGEAYEKVSGAVETAYSSIDGTVRQAAGKVGDLGSTARETYDTYLDENPLVLGAVAVALGAAVGMALPATNYEGHLMGDARRQLLDKAQFKASDLIDKTKEVVSEAGRTISEQARAASE